MNAMTHNHMNQQGAKQIAAQWFINYCVKTPA
ncbi:hypothetical protein HNP46_000061 [Pseudomonas nitritireducens]|uniref:Uncharacterized protein n=1 Tax=Pseudomonas nitroreducens TaxID=46680 RepID=A0A7W7KE97_PSENT|nr:hypothetical protein [Pseudomonas nitritireducens]